jgi:hypothetical protein
MPTLIGWIHNEMNEHDGNRMKQSALLRYHYECCNSRERKAIDDALICICGFSLLTAIQNVRMDTEDQ